MIHKGYRFPYGQSIEVDPLIGVEIIGGWIKERLGNFTDQYVIVDIEGNEFVQDIRWATFYLDEESTGTLMSYANIHLKDLITGLGLPITIYKSNLEVV